MKKILVFGQSGTLAGANETDGGAVVADPLLHSNISNFMLGGDTGAKDYTGKVLPLMEPMHHTSYRADEVGFVNSFARHSGRWNRLFVPAGKSGSGFSDGEWVPGGAARVACLNKIAEANALSDDPWELGLFSQGEADVGNLTAQEYAEHMDGLLEEIFEAAGNRFPILFSSFVPAWADQEAIRLDHEGVIGAYAMRRGYDRISQRYPTRLEKSDPSVDRIHPSDLMMEDIGQRLANKWDSPTNRRVWPNVTLTVQEIAHGLTSAVDAEVGPVATPTPDKLVYDTGVQITGDFTVSLWAKFTGSGGTSFLTKDSTNGGLRIRRAPNGTIVLNIEAESNPGAGNLEFEENRWYQMVVSGDTSGSFRVYLDGVLREEWTGTPVSTTGTIQLGGATTEDMWVGPLGEFSYFNRVLSDEEVFTHFSNQHPLI